MYFPKISQTSKVKCWQLEIFTIRMCSLEDGLLQNWESCFIVTTKCLIMHYTVLRIDTSGMPSYYQKGDISESK